MYWGIRGYAIDGWFKGAEKAFRFSSRAANQMWKDGHAKTG